MPRPIVNAGPDLTIQDNNYYLKGSGRDFDGTIKSFQWRQISGPVPVTIVGANETASIIGMSQQGVYGIELSAHDNSSPAGIGKDTVFITRDLNNPIYFTPISNKNDIKDDLNITRYNLPGGSLLLLSLRYFIDIQYLHC